MREMKIFVIVAAVIGVIYWGVEPLAHGIMHPEPEPADYEYTKMPDVAPGDATNGEQLAIANCTACHSISLEGYAAPMSPADSAVAYGVVPPDLSNAGYMYHDKFLAGFLKNPVTATHLSHKFDESYSGQGKMYPMPAYNWMSDSDINDMIAYFNKIAPSNMEDRDVFIDACARCHGMKYDGIESETNELIVAKYMGSVPPDLSMMIRSRGDHYLHSFINDPQNLLEGTAMPRVGLTKEAEMQVVKYMESVGDSKKEERNSLGIKVILFTVLIAVLAYLWKSKIWREVH